MSKRELNDWLSGYLLYVDNTEPPVAYHRWCGVSVVAGALQRKCWLEWGHEIIYPNLFVILVGPSGKCRKGIALGIAKDILSEVQGVALSSEAATREAVITAMKRAISNFAVPSGRIAFHCSLTCFSEELSVFLGQSDIKFLANLTDWYDSKDTWRYETIGRGLDQLQGVCFNLLGATAPDWLQSMLPQEAVGGGFTARVIFIVEERKGKTVPKHVLTDAERGLWVHLKRDLDRINQLVGPFRFEPDGEEAYVKWYETEDALLAKGELPIEDPRFAAYSERRATHLRKLMMIFSASRGDDMKLTVPDFKRAVDLLSAAERKMHRTFGGLGQARYSNATEQILQFIQMIKVTSRTELMRKFYRDVDSMALKTIEEMMEMTHLVTIERIPQSNEKIYKWVGKKDA